MAKLKKAFFCQNCGAQHSQWQGKCNGCGEWNTLIEELLIKKPEKEWASGSSNKASKPVRMDAIDVSAIPKTIHHCLLAVPSTGAATYTVTSW